ACARGCFELRERRLEPVERTRQRVSRQFGGGPWRGGLCLDANRQQRRGRDSKECSSVLHGSVSSHRALKAPGPWGNRAQANQNCGTRITCFSCVPFSGPSRHSPYAFHVERVSRSITELASSFAARNVS